MTASPVSSLSSKDEENTAVKAGKTPLHKSNHRDQMMKRDDERHPTSTPSSPSSFFKPIAKKDVSALQKSIQTLAANKEKAEQEKMVEVEEVEKDKDDSNSSKKEDLEPKPVSTTTTRRDVRDGVPPLTAEEELKVISKSGNTNGDVIHPEANMEDVCDVVYDANKSIHALEEEAFEQGLLTMEEMEKEMEVDGAIAA